MDIGIAGLMIGVLWPVFALAALLIKLESPGPVLIKQDRIGLGGKGFRFLKFRTMHHNRAGSDIAERLPTGDLMNRLLSPRGRPKHATAIGWTLRKTTVDELPQLVNVVKGDMSLVGPRPDMPEIVAAWPPEFRQRHQVKPGMTGLAQVNGRSDLTHYEKVKYDLRYVAEPSDHARPQDPAEDHWPRHQQERGALAPPAARPARGQRARRRSGCASSSSPRSSRSRRTAAARSRR